MYLYSLKGYKIWEKNRKYVNIVRNLVFTVKGKFTKLEIVFIELNLI